MGGIPFAAQLRIMAEAHVSLTAAAKPATPAAARRHLALGVDVLKLGHSAFAKPKSKWLVLGGKAGEERLQWAASAVEMPSGRDGEQPVAARAHEPG